MKRNLSSSPVSARRASQRVLVLGFVLAILHALTPGPARADTLERLAERLDRLEEQNRELRREIEALKAEGSGREQQAREQQAREHVAPVTGPGPAGPVRFEPKFGYEVLDPTTRINRKQHLILQRRQDGILAPDRLHVHGAVTALGSYQRSNRDSKFGYLMRHPTGTNQVGDKVSEATIHSVQLGFTGTLGDWLTGVAYRVIS